VQKSIYRTWFAAEVIRLKKNRTQSRILVESRILYGREQIGVELCAKKAEAQGRSERPKAEILGEEIAGYTGSQGALECP